MIPLLVIIGGLALPALVDAQRNDVSIRLVGEPPVFRIEKSSILQRLANPNFERIFKVFVVQPDGTAAKEQVAGDYTFDKGVLIFKPRFKLQPGTTYRAFFQLASELGSHEVTVPKPTYVSTTYVEHIYPTAPLLPENLLKFYIHFSAPMSKGEAFKRIKLVDQDGQEVKLPFLEIDEELWDKQQRRLTVLFDPGRIKTGVTPNQEVGLALQPGRKYSLLIDEAWKDAKEIPLKGGFKKEFLVGPADRNPIDPKAWQLDIPKAGTTDALFVRLLESLDAALVQRFIDVSGAQGQLIDGKVTVEENERVWIFKPNQPWTPGKYSLEILKTLEDLAGNKVGRAFEVDKIEQPAVTGAEASLTYSLPFTVPPATP